MVPTETRYMIAHDGGQRFVPITFNVTGSLQPTVNEAKARVAALQLPPGVYVEFSGAAAAQSAAQTQMLLYTGFALVLIGMILFICFHWRANTWLVLVNLPFSLIGSVAAIALVGGGLSVGAMVGLVTVFGVSARNAILLLAHYEHLVEVEGEHWNPGTVLRGAQERLIPILMTAAVTALGLMPLGARNEPAGPGNRRPDGRDGIGRLAELHASSISSCCPRLPSALAAPSARRSRHDPQGHDADRGAGTGRLFRDAASDIAAGRCAGGFRSVRPVQRADLARRRLVERLWRPATGRTDRKSPGRQSRHRPGRGASASGRRQGAPGRRRAAAHCRVERQYQQPLRPEQRRLRPRNRLQPGIGREL